MPLNTKNDSIFCRGILNYFKAFLILYKLSNQLFLCFFHLYNVHTTLEIAYIYFMQSYFRKDQLAKGVSKIPTANTAHSKINSKTNIPIYRTQFIKFLARLRTKLIPILRRMSREPIPIKSNRLQLISSVIAIPTKGINNKKRG